MTKEKCTFCNKYPSSARWNCPNGPVYCCPTCAHEQLPKFFADAVFLHGDDRAMCAQRALKDFGRLFWRSIAIRFERER